MHRQASLQGPDHAERTRGEESLRSISGDPCRHAPQVSRCPTRPRRPVYVGRVPRSGPATRCIARVPLGRHGRVSHRLPGSACRKSLSAHTLPLPPASRCCCRQLPSWHAPPGVTPTARSRRTNSRRGLAAIDFRRSVSARSAGQPLSDTPAPPGVRGAGAAQRTRHSPHRTRPLGRHGRVSHRLPGSACRKSLSAHTLPLPPASRCCCRQLPSWHAPPGVTPRARSRRTNSRRGIAAIDLRRSVSARSAGQPLSDTPAPPGVRRAGAAQRTRHSRWGQADAISGLRRPGRGVGAAPHASCRGAPGVRRPVAPAPVHRRRRYTSRRFRGCSPPPDDARSR